MQASIKQFQNGQIKRSNSVLLIKQKVLSFQKNRLSIQNPILQKDRQGRMVLQSLNQSKYNLQIEQGSSFSRKNKQQYIKKTEKSMLIIQKAHHGCAFRKTSFFQENENINDSLQSIIRILENNFILSQRRSNVFTIKKDHLKKLIQTTLLFKFLQGKQKLLQHNSEFNYIASKLLDLNEANSKKSRLHRLNSCRTVDEKFTRNDYLSEISEKKSQISFLQQAKKAKEVAISQLQQAFNTSYSQKQAISKIITEKQYYLYNLEEKCSQQEKRLAELEVDTEKKKKFYEEALQSELAILNFVGNQDKSKIIKLVSEDYKRIEGDLYEYATYLQANQLASSLTYEHLPIICHTHNLQEELADVCKSLIQNEEMLLVDKCRKMRDFLLGVIEKYRKKDLEIEKLMQFKTKCIINFIAKMKMWLHNWELKQQYLKNLRIQHALTHEKMTQTLDLLRVCQESNKQGSLEKIQLLRNLDQKLDENYKMGNSFY